MAADVEQQKFSRYRSVRKAQSSHHLEESPPLPPFEPSESPAKSETLGRSMSRYHRQRPTTSSNNQSFAAPKRANTQDMAAPAPPPLPANANATVSRARAATLNSSAQPSRYARRGTTSRKAPTSPPTSVMRSPPRMPAQTLVERVSREPPKTAHVEARQLMEAEAERQRKVSAKLRAERRVEAEEKKQVQAQEELRAKRAIEEQQVRAKQEADIVQQQKFLKEKARALEEKEKTLQAKEKAQQKVEQEREAAIRASNERREIAKRIQREAPNLNARRVSPPASPPDNKPEQHSPSRIKDKISFLRKRSQDNPRHHRTGDVPGQREVDQQKARDAALPDPYIRAGGGGIVPGTDAPISAVNAGDRRVLIECNEKQIRLPVTPLTTPVDLIRSCETVLTEKIDVSMSVLLEGFGKVGVQRPLRKYEHVRDVMNTWDSDTQNSLLLVPITSGADEELDESKIPKEKPEFAGYLYHSQKPGKWKKEWISLKSDGQMLTAKNETGKDESSMCHLSDFDIYTPTQRKLRSIKPPKKTCFAVKSQQKSNIFSDTTSFVHFFCSSDRDTATRFYQAVQGWRSWYLVNIMGEGKKAKEAASATPFKLDLNFGSAAAAGGHTKNKSSVDSHYMLGTFQPMLDSDTFNQMEFAEVVLPPLHLAGSTLNEKDSKTMHVRKMSMRQKAPPPSSFPEYFSETETNPSNPITRTAKAARTQPTPLISTTDNTFASTGLLGKIYTERQREKAERDREIVLQNSLASGPFTDGPSLLNTTAFPLPPSTDAAQPSSSGLTRNSSVRSTHKRNSSDLKHTKSLRRPPPAQPKPLVDLTPQYKEPPQHALKGKGFKPADTAAGNLIENATSLATDNPYASIPPSTDWRARPRANTLTRGGGPAPPSALHTQENPYAVERSEDAFTGQGLLASAGPSQGGGSTGRGVMDGSRAKGPMVDLREDSVFGKGSLLQGVERAQGSGVVIDRERRVEGNVVTGEGC
ncbi:hypothetical protein EJ05DRAFT_513753 [Pseudovirgaria hyperparasitica]|uniref:PH domain-containing protein n=1 Tax=Pseudovirgaria hyperparasitica TaxID=470096 RepID=A0A6A6VYM5_9PEZI|nr:uncharacterized protein EJ05DRAFT_513753 [Pseudovirgaria hyperparasitica]KAF2754834.1 hypothetical protein EJ05DRAFT_513753 [Pseudovirgaria hyperparasitica]